MFTVRKSLSGIPANLGKRKYDMGALVCGFYLEAPIENASNIRSAASNTSARTRNHEDPLKVFEYATQYTDVSVPEGVEDFAKTVPQKEAKFIRVWRKPANTEQEVIYAKFLADAKIDQDKADAEMKSAEEMATQITRELTSGDTIKNNPSNLPPVTDEGDQAGDVAETNPVSVEALDGAMSDLEPAISQAVAEANSNIRAKAGKGKRA